MDDSEFLRILSIEKKFKDKFVQPTINASKRQILTDSNKNDYVFDYQLGSAGNMVITIELVDAKQKWQTRLPNSLLVRVDINSPAHMDENGNLSRNHIHMFYPSGTKVYDISNFDENLYKDLSPFAVLIDFFKQNNIVLSNNEFIQGVI